MDRFHENVTCAYVSMLRGYIDTCIVVAGCI